MKGSEAPKRDSVLLAALTKAGRPTEEESEVGRRVE